MTSYHDRARGAFAGFVLGDSLGMPTRAMSGESIIATYGFVIGLGPASTVQPMNPGMGTGSVTSRTEHALLVASMIDGGPIDPTRLARLMVAWDDRARMSGRLDLLEAESRYGFDQLLAGVPGDHRSTTCEPTAWVLPLGLAHSSEQCSDLGDAVYVTCQSTHRSRQAVEGAALFAHIISAGVDGAGVDDAIEYGLEIVASTPRRGEWTSESSVIARTLQAIDWAENLRDIEIGAHLHDIVGLSKRAGEAIPAAIIIAKAFSHDPCRGLCLAAQIGGETCAIGSMAGAILGACLGIEAFPQPVLAQIAKNAAEDALDLADRLVLLSGRGTAVKGSIG
ncbi:ADP-ribosylglycohydrolase family protein [Flaviflexus equikiangi]|uniref:ADP-ribosylglycohydrolase family protein n=1 Tax=Flaviflexus equikiangi TaxID=2758573 RepID=A0ABS2TDR6_9ACTO|nr:ADP-ribosylglycohydrolase family protein [Flaviflexus equikiangi]MBM9432799.1 ADP-ribosylglycohydrolase family protein [Flaviflexus equikiangi]